MGNFLSSLRARTPLAFDHTVYPHIIDRILRFTDDAAFVAFASTSRKQHQRLSPQFQWRAVRRRGRHAALHATADGLALTTPDCVADLPWLPGVVEVLDLHGECIRYATHKALTRGQRSAFSQLETIRRLPLDHVPFVARVKARRRLPDVLTVVDYIDFDKSSSQSSTLIDITSCSKKHVLHMRWSADVIGSMGSMDMGLRSFELSRNPLGAEYTVILWPSADDNFWEAGAAKRRVVDYIENLYRFASGPNLTIVAPSRSYAWIHLPDLQAPIVYMSHEEWRAKLGDQKGVIGNCIW
ncbi:hypothetical protein Q8F55_000039 [Vanrija albida]|uniref:F-box domain-containing protein n=1 Tax=Vanrija albida TaxID=181172 RepID=A0ABR3QCC3_9TREE